MKTLEEKILEATGMTEHDIKKALTNGCTIEKVDTILEDFDYLYKEHCAEEDKDEFLEYLKNKKDGSRFYDSDIVELDGEYYYISYCL